MSPSKMWSLLQASVELHDEEVEGAVGAAAASSVNSTRLRPTGPCVRAARKSDEKDSNAVED